jgi:hypothetical protein
VRRSIQTRTGAFIQRGNKIATDKKRSNYSAVKTKSLQTRREAIIRGEISFATCVRCCSYLCDVNFD